MHDDIINEAMDELKEMVEHNKLLNEKSNNFIIDYEWEDDFSHNEISDMQEKFAKQAKEYLLEKCADKYVVYIDWCVHICSIDFMNERSKVSARRKRCVGRT